ncbi:hypothetical protein [Streptomyces noursei]|uniref:hypothetical protein n=1 Tax=Streptomyces noursei TaxID=1971 RepID=UPI0008348AAD
MADLTSVTKDGRLQLQLPADEAKAALAAYPSGARLIRRGAPPGTPSPNSWRCTGSVRRRCAF